MKLPNRKRCSICKKLKSLKEYSPCRTGKYGLYNYCRECRNNRNKEINPNRSVIDEVTARRKGLRNLGLKTCSSCKTVKPLDDFYPDTRHADGKQSFCKECFIQKNNSYYLMKEYGITLEDYYKLLEAQNGVCAICGRPPKNNKFNIDHDHTTHYIRALLCVNCNTNILPYVEDFPVWVQNAFEYLKNPPAFSIIGKREVPETNQARSNRHKK